MTSKELKLNRAYSLSMTREHSPDFRELLCPEMPDETAVNAMEAVLFEEDREERANLFPSSSRRSKGQQGLEMVKKARAEEGLTRWAFVDVRMPRGGMASKQLREYGNVDPELQVVVCTAVMRIIRREEMRAKSGTA